MDDPESETILEKFTGVKKWTMSMGAFSTKRGEKAHKKHKAAKGNTAAMGSMQDELRMGDFHLKGEFLSVTLPQG